MRSRPRLLAYGAVAVLAAAAVRFTPPLPPADVAAGHPLAPNPDAPTPARTPLVRPWRLRVDTLGKGESLYSLLARGGVSEAVAREALRATSTLDMRRIPAGLRVTTRTATADNSTREIVFHLGIDRLLKLTRTTAGWEEREERLPWTTDTIVVASAIRTTLYGALDAGADGLLPPRARAELAWSLADIFEYRVDMSRDLQAGDSLKVLLERSTAPTGAVKVGKIIAVDFSLSGAKLAAVRYESRKWGSDYYDQNGKSLRAQFLRAPLNFRRISSGFGFRRHPILGVWKKHQGTDYAASTGTPVRAIGDGIVVYAGWRGGYGNTLEIRHRNGFVTRYGHLSAFARSARRGAFVAMGSTVAFVGSTGMSTAPHLHFEVLVGGQQQDPRVALRDKSGIPIAESEKAAFAAHRDRLLTALSGGLRVATR